MKAEVATVETPMDRSSSVMKEDVHNDEYGVEAELTSLSWLQSLDITSASNLPTPPCSPSPPPVNRQARKKLSPLIKAELDLSENAEKYRTDPDAKPPFSYATIICLAMRANNNKVSLSNIYAWIRENFLFYKYADPAWQNSIRHNLSLNKCFVKLPRSKGEPGKGGFWKLDLERLEEGRKSKRRATMSQRIRGTKKQPPAAKTAMNNAQSSTVPSISSLSTLYETPPSSVSPPIPDCLTEMPDSTQVSLSEDDLTGLLIATAAWDENQLDLLDSFLDTL
ncbi:PREDICTED: forkhead box protein J1-B-like [Dufourea novaeangliae]|uniref:Forkhead box protein J1-B n=1 Tax=Dufourea novaeangliae TaxID=178035 RepID=A0A154P640_DUFNO|nr:PREDICTED: forkhead box protein J1-B-like [Dufourea novaeangliae]KZC07327.1 Forkhead box protein J1-B [Dufourea novaeangliae]